MYNQLGLASSPEGNWGRSMDPLCVKAEQQTRGKDTVALILQATFCII